MNPEVPLVTVVTPVLDGAPFIRATIESVLAQDYPAIEYLVVDGGSSDGTPAIVASYAESVRFVRDRDRGQADAVNCGFEQGNGSILAFLNADDVYAPGAVSRGVAALASHPEAGVAYGLADLIDESGTAIGWYPVEPFAPATFAERCYIAQPASFIRRDAYEAVGGFDPELHYAFDYDFWIRLSRVRPFVKIDDRLASARVHDGSKTVAMPRPACSEAVSVLLRHFGYAPYAWMYALANAIVGPGGSRTRKVALSLFLGLLHNWRAPLRYTTDWTSYRGFAGRR